MHDEAGHKHSDPRTEAVAREAARLMELGQVPTLRAAIHRAMEHMRAQDALRPSALQVRQHARAMSMQALGQAGYQQRIVDMWRWVEEFMTAVEHGLPDAETVLVGRAAEGLVDAGLVIHLRVHTKESIKQLAAVLVEYDYAEPTFETVETKHGRLNRLRLVDEEEGYEAVAMRIKHTMRVQRDRCVFTGKVLAARTLSEVRSLLEKES